MDVSDIFYFCSGAGEREEVSEEVARGAGFNKKIEGGGGFRGGGAGRGKGAGGMSVGTGGGELNFFFFRGRNAHQIKSQTKSRKKRAYTTLFQ